MASVKQAAEERLDARKLWIPASVAAALLLAVVGGAVAAGMWVQQLNDSRAATANLAAELKSVNSSLATMQGSLNALMGMQAALSETRAEVGSLDSRLDSFETRLQTMDAWIQTTRQRLSEQGMATPNYGNP